MAAVTIGIFVFGLLLQRRREYITLRAQGIEPSTIRLLIAAEAGTIAVGGSLAGVLVGVAMGLYFVKVLQPLFVHVPRYIVPFHAFAVPIVLVCIGTMISSIAGSRLVNGLHPTELLRDE
jgi:ABC-type antimicrobial peptide transport system permease subunit